jgi:DNA mismatch repair protein MutS
MEQYRKIKAKFPKEILFFRLGDFYEVFYDDAKIAAKVLCIALTSREKGPDAVPMAGVPHHSVHVYIRRLLQAGYNVAICEQMEDPETAVGIVDRAVTQIITPGTFIDEKFLSTKQNNYIAALIVTGKTAGISTADLSTGEFFVQEIPAEQLVSEVVRISPAEALFPESMERDQTQLVSALRASISCAYQERPDWEFGKSAAYRTLTNHFGTKNLAGFGCEEMETGICAAGALLSYLIETQRASLPHISALKPVARAQGMILDATTCRCLELVETQMRREKQSTLLSVLDSTVTPMGARLLRRYLLSPLTDISEIHRRQDAVEELVKNHRMRDSIKKLLKDCGDLLRLSARISSGRCNARDLVALSSSLLLVPRMKSILADATSDILKESAQKLQPLDELTALVGSAIVSSPPLSVREGGIIRPGFSKELDELQRLKREGKQYLATFQSREIERTGIKNLKVGYNKVFGYYIEVTNSYKAKVPANYVRKQTLKDAERYSTDELKEWEERILTASERSQQMEYEIFQSVREKAASVTEIIQENAHTIALIDVLTSFASCAVSNRYTRPVVHDGDALEIIDGRHPVLETLADFVPNDILLDGADNRALIITGPNMAGKSTYVRQVALLVIMAQMGSFIPAASAKIGIVDRIFTRVGALDEIYRGSSTFMVEMSETANILNNATERSLVILDEVGRGTSTFDGLSLAWAIMEYIRDRVKSRTLFATHYHELTELALLSSGVKNYNVAVREAGDDVIFLHKIIPGGTDKSYGIHVARLAGIPSSVVERAKEVLSEIESHSISLGEKPIIEEGAEREESKKQLSLFPGSGEELANLLREIDLNTLTPLDALNKLKELKDRVENH